MTKHLCIYHGNCDDGFAAAWCVRHALGAHEVEFHPGAYRVDPPDVTDRSVILVDFSYRRPVLDKMAKAAKSLLILDHHKTAMEDLAGMGSALEWGDHLAQDGVHVLFDMSRSGATIAWDYFNPKEQRPEFIAYIEDRDLWRKELPGGDEFTIALRSYPQDFDIWTAMIARGTGPLIAEGHSIQRYYRLRVEEMKRSAYKATIRGIVCMISNAPYFAASEVAGELAETDGVRFGATYFEARPGVIQYSLRSRDDFDVSVVARPYGGGGHRSAAGFSSPWPVHNLVAS